jgi:acetolactate synthase small subunit
MTTTHMLSLRLGKELSVLARVVVLFCSRDVQVESLHLEPTDRDDTSRLDVVVGLPDGRPVEGLVNQLSRIVDVGSVEVVSPAQIRRRAPS